MWHRFRDSLLLEAQAREEADLPIPPSEINKVVPYFHLSMRSLPPEEPKTLFHIHTRFIDEEETPSDE